MKRTEASGQPSRGPKPSSSTISWTRPQPTDVIRYVYLWHAEHERGLEDGRKTRPCLVVSTYEQGGGLRVITAPITTRNYSPAHSVEIPIRVAHHLGLDERSRIVWNDLNLFTWVGPDVRTGPDGNPFIGIMPERLWRQVIDNIVQARVPATPRI
ncbi:MAG TPA: hypothetical protein VF503_15095 [Sphingobium sp.]|uniref:hypothetical protein n=1 Tax=Sphingobium sp. TaxID=1912891 RepID=UPI002ED3EA32